MKFKLQTHHIDVSTHAKLISNFAVVFSFNETLLSNAKKHISGLKLNTFDNLSDSGNYSLVNSDTLVVSLGQKDKFNIAEYHKALRALSGFLSSGKKISAIDLIIEESVAKLLDITVDLYVEQSIFYILNNLYYFDQFKSKKHVLHLTEIKLISKVDYKNALENAASLLDGVSIVKNLGNSPANIATPTHLAETALKFTKISKKVKVEIFDEKAIKKLGMNAFLAVAQGSAEEPKFIKMEYNGAKSSVKPIVLVGKGITFDSGGISIKPSANMNEMKFDMCGAATVIGVFAAVAKLGLNVNLVAVVPSCENMPSANAVKPGDVVTSLSGQTIEIVNTDAEGRLVLCDALAYVKRFDPELVIDVATLTGACVIALGNVASGLYSNDDKLANGLMDSAQNCNDKVWRMPLYSEYMEQIKSPVADMMNIGGWGGKAGSVTAAMFLLKFVDYKWAHLDIAGTAWGGAFAGGEAGATGRPFYLLVDFIRKQAK